jgi:hypothetical protein
MEVHEHALCFNVEIGGLPYENQPPVNPTLRMTLRLRIYGSGKI